MINIRVTATTLCELLGGKFSEEACEALDEYFEECGAENTSYFIGDIAAGFGEVPEGDEDDEERIIAHLENGNVLIYY